MTNTIDGHGTSNKMMSMAKADMPRVEEKAYMSNKKVEQEEGEEYEKDLEQVRKMVEI